MFVNKCSPAIFLYSFRDGKWVQRFDSEEQLLIYLVRKYDTFFGPDHEVNLTWNDKKVVTNRASGQSYMVLRNYVFVDANHRIVNPEMYRSKVEALMTGFSECERERLARCKYLGLDLRFWNGGETIPHDELHYGDTLHNCDTNDHFRKDPVPGTGHNRWRKHWYRSPGTTQEHREMANPEMTDYIRRKRKHIPTTYDDIPRGHQRNWKAQSKKRKQWM